MLGKALKYTCWGAFTLFVYHMFLIKKYEKPEEALLASDPFLSAARWLDWSIYDLKILFTKPGMTKMLPDRMEMPGMM